MERSPTAQPDNEFWIRIEPQGIQVSCDTPRLLSKIIQEAGIPLKSGCGGHGICKQCLVRLTTEYLNPPSDFEQRTLTARQLSQVWRFACRTMIFGDTRVFIPEDSLIEHQIKSFDDIEVLPLIPENNFKILPVYGCSPSPGNPIPALEQVAVFLKEKYHIQGVNAELPALKNLGTMHHKNDSKVWIALNHNQIINTYGSKPRALGLAVDVGTTKLAGFLLDLKTGDYLAHEDTTNPQTLYGDDLMSRLSAVLSDPVAGQALQDTVIKAINNLAARLCESNGFETNQILDLCLVGNPAMHHLMLGLPIRGLALSPFVGACSRSLDVATHQLGLIAAPGAYAHIPPVVAGFIGGDHLAFLLAAGFPDNSSVTLGIDIGTNTEIALQLKDQIVCCSAASGPAFEGGRLSHGVRAAQGAISGVTIDADGKINLSVIGNCAPRGICGSGIIAALYEMRINRILDKRGRLNEASKHVHDSKNGKPRFLLSPSDDFSGPVWITQDDIDQVLLAKGAIRAGINILLDDLNLAPSDLNRIILAGAFGSFLNVEKAMGVGLLPPIQVAKVSAIGNAAGTGAAMMLVSITVRQKSLDLAAMIKHKELASHPKFHRHLACAMMLNKAGCEYGKN